LTDERLIGFFDLLGFKNYIKERPLEDVVQAFTRVFYAMFSAAVRHRFRMGDSSEVILAKFEKFTSESNLKIVKERFEAETGFNVLLMSDSIVLFSDEIDREHPLFLDRVATLILVSRILMMNLFEQILPARGALAYGEFHANREYGIYAGNALVEAYEVAESQEWIGTIVSSSLEDAVTDLVHSFRYKTLYERVISRNLGTLCARNGTLCGTMSHSNQVNKGVGPSIGRARGISAVQLGMISSRK
jgi:hypothetical protein